MNKRKGKTQVKTEEYIRKGKKKNIQLDIKPKNE